MLAAFVTTILFSISAVSGSRSSRVLGGTEAHFWRLCFATLLLGLIAHTIGGALAGAAFPILFVSGCVGFGISDLALFQTLPRLGSRLSVMFGSCLASPIAALIEWLWLGTKLTPAQLLCSFTILTGVAIALTPGHHLSISRRQWGWGIFFGLLAAAGQGFGAVLSRKAYAVAVQAHENIDGITAAYQRIVGGMAVTVPAFLVVKRAALAQSIFAGAGERRAMGLEKREAWRRALPWVLLNGLAGPALGVACYQWALKNYPTGVVLPIVAITPLVIIPFSTYLEGERPTLRSLLGGAIAVIGAVALAFVGRH
jgi:drug/metabolite transporter (DMT)-like permease